MNNLDELASLFGHRFDLEKSFVLTFTHQGTLIWASDALLQLLGHTRADFDQAKVDWDAITPLEYWMLDEHCLAQLSRGNFADPYVIELLHKEGKRIAFRVQAARRISDRSQVIALLTELVERPQAEPSGN